MYKMVEVVGRAKESLSEAVKDAVNQVNAAGEKAQFFVVQEQRGLIKGGKVEEFQVIVKVGVNG